MKNLVRVCLTCWAFLAGQAFAEIDFSISTFETGVSMEQAVLPGFFRSSDRADLVIARIDEDGNRTVSIHEMDESLSYKEAPVAEFELPSDVIALDVGRLGARDILVFLTARRAIAYDPFNDTVQSLVSYSSMYNNPVDDDVPVMDLLRDMNGDGLDDFMIPTFEGFDLHLQKADGHFADPVKLYAPPLMQMTYNNNPWYQLRAMFMTDMNFDMRDDIVFWIDGKFAVYPQDDDGRFSPEAIFVPSNIPFEFDGVEGVSFEMGEQDQSDLTARALYKLKDLDGDGVTDLVTFTVTSKGVFNKSTTYEIHPGSRGEDGKLVFAEEPSSIIESKGVQFDIQEKDLDRNGEMDMVVSSVQIGIGKIVAALITGSVDFDLDFYQMQNGVYPKEPNANREITATFDLSSGDFFFPFVLIADINGDPYLDLLVQDGLDTIKIYEGERGDRLFNRRATELSMTLPNEPDLVQLADLNGDGRQDLVMRIEKKNESNRVSVLMSREVQQTAQAPRQ